MTSRKAAAVSMEPELFQRAKLRATKLGFPTFSAYMVQLLRADLIKRGEISVQEDESTDVPAPRTEVVYEPKKKTKAKD